MKVPRYMGSLGMVRDIRGRPEGSGQRAWQASGRGEHGHRDGRDFKCQMANQS